jgi:xanthosine utilization system XapX-like protein
MERIEPTRALALKIWWAFMWRAVLAALAAGFAIGLVVGLLSVLLGLAPEAVSTISGFLGLVLGAGVSIEVMYRLLRKKFDGFEIAIVRAE